MIGPDSTQRVSGIHTLSVVIPVYRGESTLPAVMDELLPYTQEFRTASGHAARITQIVLVHDNGPDRSDVVIRELAEQYSFVTPVWLSRNFGQHPTTLAGMTCTTGDWIVTMDEDGQHDPASIPVMLDMAMAQQADVVYAQPATRLAHSALRNFSSRMAKRVIAFSAGNKAALDFSSLRLVLGQTGRSVAEYASGGAYLDVAMTWVARKIVTCQVNLRRDTARPSGYNYRSLFSHFWRMSVTSGTKALRVVSLFGALFATCGVLLALYLLIAKVFLTTSLPAGWPSLMVMVLLSSGAILLSLGIIAEYIGVNVSMAMGRPTFLIATDPAHGPLGRPPSFPPGEAGPLRPALTDEKSPQLTDVRPAPPGFGR